LVTTGRQSHEENDPHVIFERRLHDCTDRFEAPSKLIFDLSGFQCGGGSRDPEISRAGVRPKGQDHPLRTVPHLRSPDEGSCGEGLRGFESHPPHFLGRPENAGDSLLFFALKAKGNVMVKCLRSPTETHVRDRRTF